MAKWDIFEIGFNNLEETLNFGNRPTDGDSLYEITTFGVIRSSEEHHKANGLFNLVSCCEPHGKICVGIDNRLVVVTNIEEPNYLIIHEFDSVLQGVALSGCGNSILVTTEAGSIFIGDLTAILTSDLEEDSPKEFPQVFQEEGSTNHKFIGTFSYLESKLPEFYVVADNGLVKKFTLLAIDGKSFTSEIVYDFKQSLHIATFGYPYIVVEGEELLVLDVRTKICKSDDALYLDRLFSLKGNILALDAKNAAYVIEPGHCQIHNVQAVYTSLAQKYSLSSSNVAIFDDDTGQLVVVEVSDRVQAYASLRCDVSTLIYDIPLEHRIRFLNVTGYSEEIPFLTEVSPEELRLQFVTATEPEIRLKKLIRTGNLDNAERFAEKHGLDTEMVVRARILNILAKNECSSDDVSLLLKLLDSVNSRLFRVQCCEGVACTLPGDLKRVLNYAIGLETDQKASSKKLDLAKNRLTELLRRFHMYMNVYKTYDLENWKVFCESDPVSQMLKFLQEDEFNKAILMAVGTFYHEESVTALSDNTIIDILNTLNTSLLEGCVAFVKIFIPMVVKYKPEVAYIFATWVQETVLRMEGKADFPQCALEFLEKSTARITSTHDCENYEKSIVNLREALHNIQTMLTNYGIRLALANFLSNGRWGFVTTLLDLDWEPERLGGLIRDFVRPFLIKRGMNADSLICDYMKKQLTRAEQSWSGKAYAILRCLTNQDLQLDLIIEILKCTSKPWSVEVKKVAWLAFENPRNNPKVEDVKKLLKNEHALAVFQRYNIASEEFCKVHHKQACLWRILYQCGDDVRRAFSDIRAISDDDLKGDIFALRKMLDKKQLDGVLSILDDLDLEDRTRLCMKLFEYLCMEHLDSFSLKKGQIEAKALKEIYKRLLDKNFQNEYKYVIAKGVYDMYQHYGLIASLQDLSQDRKMHYLREVVLKKASELLSQEESFDFPTLLSHCKMLAPVFGVSTDAVLTEFTCMEMNSEFRVEIAEQLEKRSQNSGLLVRCAISILDLPVQSESSSVNDTFLDTIETNSPNQDSEAVVLAKRLCVKAVLHHSDEYDLWEALELTRIIDYAYHLDFATEAERELVRMQQIYVPRKIVNSQSGIVGAVLMIHRTLSDIAGSTAVVLSDEISITAECSDLLKKFLDGISCLLFEEQHLKASNLIKLVHLSCLSNPSPLSSSVIATLQKCFTTTLLPQLVSLVIGHNYVDTRLLLELIMQFPKEEIQTQIAKFLRMYKYHPAKLRAVAQVGLHLIDLGLMDVGEKHLSNYLNLSKWWFKLDGLKCQKTGGALYSKLFSGTSASNFELLIKEDKLPLECFPEFCHDFKVNLQNGYFYQLKWLIVNWQPHLVYSTEVDGRKTVAVDNSDALNVACDKVVNFITDKKRLLQFTADLWPSVNFYHYEVYQYLLKLRQTLGCGNDKSIEAYRPFVQFLETYSRVRPPARSEIEQCFGLNKSEEENEPLSAFRLPLSNSFLSESIWDIIKSEITLRTYKDWLKLSMMGIDYLSKQQICSYAINSASEEFPPGDSDWGDFPKHEHLVEKVDECAATAADLEIAAAAVYSLMCAMPPGADKVRMAKLSYKYAKMLLDEKPSSENVKVFEKVEHRYLTYSVRHVLHKYHVVNDGGHKFDRTVDLCAVATTMYSDPRIENDFCDVTNFLRPDVNNAVKELCTIYDQNFHKIQMHCLIKILDFEPSPELDWRRLGRDTESNRLKHAVYMCRDKEKVSTWRQVLFKWTREDCTTLTVASKANALKCLYFISDSQTLKNMFGLAVSDFVVHVSKIVVISNLVHHGITCYSVSDLDQINKKKVLRQLALINKPDTIKCIASICRIYDYGDIKYWDYIIQSVVAHKLMDDLRDYLEFLSKSVVTESVLEGWRDLLTYELGRLNWETAQEDNAFALLKSCPVFKLDLTPFIDKCLSNKRPDLAQVFEQFTTS